MTGIQGATGPLGPIGLVGQTGPQGPTGPAGSFAPVAFFAGFKWGPAAPYGNALANLTSGVLMSLGGIPFASGNYLLHLELQIAWNSQTAGINVQNGDGFLRQRFDAGTAEDLYQCKWSRLNSDSGRSGNGTLQSYSFQIQANNMKQFWNLEFQATGEFFPVGCQVTVFNLPGYVMVPGSPAAANIIPNSPTN